MNQELILPSQKLIVGGEFTVDHVRDGEVLERFSSKNMIVNEGLNSLLGVYLHGDTQITTWYVGIFEGSGYNPASDDTASNIVARSTEITTAYSQTNRVTWVEAAASGQSITNSASKAQFDFTSSKTVYGAFLVSTNTKGGTTGTLFASSKFGAARAVVNGDQLLITYTVAAADA